MKTIHRVINVNYIAATVHACVFSVPKWIAFMNCTVILYYLLLHVALMFNTYFEHM